MYTQANAVAQTRVRRNPMLTSSAGNWHEKRMVRRQTQILRRIRLEMKHGPIMHHKISLEVFNYWNSIRGLQDAPLRASFDPAVVRHNLPHIFILEALEGAAVRFRLAGTQVCGLFGGELRGQPFSCLWREGHADSAETTAQTALDNGTPVLIEANGHTESGRNIGFEICLLPMRSSASGCDRLLGCIASGTGKAWMNGDVLIDLVIERTVALNQTVGPERSVTETARGSAWAWTRSAAGLEAAARRAFKIVSGGDPAAR